MMFFICGIALYRPSNPGHAAWRTFPCLTRERKSGRGLIGNLKKIPSLWEDVNYDLFYSAGRRSYFGRFEAPANKCRSGGARSCYNKNGAPKKAFATKKLPFLGDFHYAQARAIEG
jgi:hypothetical protein